MNDPEMAQSTVKNTGDVILAIENLDGAVVRLQNIVGTVLETTSPICRQDPPTEAGELEKREVICALSHQIFSIRDRIDDVTTQLNDLLSRIEL